MDNLYNDNFSLHLAPIPRRFSVAPSVSNIGYTRQKREMVRNTFESYNFSFILSGDGIYLYRGEYLEVHGPCVITQAPGVPMEYGPTATWEELYLIYDNALVPTFIQQGLIRNDTPLWRIHDPTQVQNHLADLFRLLKSPVLDPHIDKVDALCTLLVMESILGETREEVSNEQRIINELVNHVRTHLHEEIDFHAFARQCHMHPATFRRHWLRCTGLPPTHYLIVHRIREACRLLVETRLPIGEIAALLRFDDPLYFSRIFKQYTHMTASAYREHYRFNLTTNDGIEELPARYAR